MSQLSYASGASDQPLMGQTLGENLRRTAERVPSAEALVVPHQGVRMDYRAFFEATGRVARGLMAKGVSKGDRVGIWSPNRAEWVVLQYASARAGAILVNLNPAYRAHELEYALKQSGISVLIMARGFRQTAYGPILEAVQGNCPMLREVLVIDEDWAALEAAGEAIPEAALAVREAELSFEDPINIQYTSGTTGFPKGATLSHHNILNNGFFIGERLRYTERDRVCLPVPLYHCFGMVLGNMAATTHGAAIVLAGEAFDPEETLRVVALERCTSLYGVPTMFIAELEHPSFGRHDLGSLRTGIMAGSPCPVETMRRVLHDMHMPEVTICYGMTETSPVSTQSACDDPLEQRVATVGTVHPHLEIKIVDPATGAILPRGSIGELCTRGYSVMLGYWNDPKATREAIDLGGWMHTGDLASMDEGGHVHITGRLKDMVLRGGENLYPKEIEAFLHTLPGVQDVQVVGVPDEKYGEELMAWIQPKAGAHLTEEGIRAQCRGRIASMKIPRHVAFVEGFPLTVTGKVQKYRLREMGIERLGLERAAAVITA